MAPPARPRPRAEAAVTLPPGGRFGLRPECAPCTGLRRSSAAIFRGVHTKFI